MMVRKKKNTDETATTPLINHETAAPAAEEDQTFTSLHTNLAEINKRKGILGYILRNATSATIDLKDPTKLIEYASLSSQTLDSGKEISELCDVGDIENILIQGKDIKALCVNIGENKASIFMEKDADHADILRRVSP